MSQTKIGKTLPKKILDGTIREAIAQAIKQEHSDITSVVKSIAAVTGIDANTIAKWHKRKNTPSAAHFMTFSAFYPSGLRILLTIIGREDLWQLAVQENIPEKMQETLAAHHTKYQKRGDIFASDTIKKYAFSFNKRQLWFLNMLQKTKRMQNRHIASHWNVALRTAKRDTEALIAEGFIVSMRSGGTGWFEWTGKAC